MIEVRNRRRYRAIAWTAGTSTAALTAIVIWASALDGFFGPLQGAYFTAALTGIVGAMIASRQPQNSVGWLMLTVGLLTAATAVPYDYGYWDVVVRHNALPLGGVALWLASWAWLVPFGTGFAVITVRFPHGRTERYTHLIDRLCVVGTVASAFALAVRPGPLYPSGRIDNPVALTQAGAAVETLFAVGLIVIVLTDVMAVASLIVRYRHAHGDERQQIKWAASAAVVVAAALVLSAIGMIALRQPMVRALVPFSLSTIAMPVAIGIAILRYRLYEIDVLISKALVYGSLTAILAGLYTFIIGLSQKLFAFYTGQRSDAALLVTAFVVAAAFTPVKHGLENLADRRLSRPDPAGTLDKMAETVESVVAVIDSERVARGLVQRAVKAFAVSGGRLTLTRQNGRMPIHQEGYLGQVSAVIELHARGKVVGRMALGSRHGRAQYSHRELAALGRAADAVGEAIDLSRAPILARSEMSNRTQLEVNVR